MIHLDFPVPEVFERLIAPDVDPDGINPHPWQELTPERRLILSIIAQGFDDSLRDREHARDWWRLGGHAVGGSLWCCQHLDLAHDALLSKLEEHWMNGVVRPFTRIRNVSPAGRRPHVGTQHNGHRRKRRAA